MIPTTAFLAASLGKIELQGELFFAHMALIARDPRFSAVVVSLGDTLMRHNMPDTPDAYGVSIALGNRWIEDTKVIFNPFVERSVILRHDEQISDPFYPEIRFELGEIFQEGVFAAALARDIDGFVARGGRAGTEDQREACRAYILEELAADIAFARREPFSQIYPGKPLHSYLAMMEEAEHLPEVVRGIEHCALLRTRAAGNKVWFAGTPIVHHSKMHSA